MKINQDTVVTFKYSLKDASNDEVIEFGDSSAPMVYIHGYNGILPALEKDFENKEVGAKFTTSLTAGEAYGHKQEGASQRVPIKHLSGAKKWKPGMVAVIRTEQGEHQVSIVKVGHTMATVDTNHPLAGKSLIFDIEIIDVRAATQVEIDHRHAHGPGGYQH